MKLQNARAAGTILAMLALTNPAHACDVNNTIREACLGYAEFEGRIVDMRDAGIPLDVVKEKAKDWPGGWKQWKPIVENIYNSSDMTKTGAPDMDRETVKELAYGECLLNAAK
jgi:hypothetical protein